MSEISSLYSHAATVLPVKNLTRSRDFYRDTLSFSVEFEWEDPPSYAVIRGGEDIQIHLSLVDNPDKQTIHPSLIYLFVRDIDTLHNELASRDATILRPPETFDYGMREFEVTDPDGHRLIFGQGI